MRVTLASYLAVTGGLTLLVLAMPSLVVLGFFMLVVPGLILLSAVSTHGTDLRL